MTIKRPANGWELKGLHTHPGEVLREDYLVPLGLSVNQLALRLRVPATRMQEIVHERRGVSPDTALRLARFFGTTPSFWLNLQQNYDLTKAQMEHGKDVEAGVQPMKMAS